MTNQQVNNNHNNNNNNNDDYRSLILIENKIKRAKISLILLSFLQLIIVFVYISIKNNLDHIPSTNHLKNDSFIFNLITYFGLSFSLAGLIVSLFENYCFISCFAITNLGHLIIVMTRATKFLLFSGYFAINICIILISFIFSHLLRMKQLQLQLQLQRSNNNDQQQRNHRSSSIFNINENLFRQPQPSPPSYKEVIKNPEKYPCLFDNKIDTNGNEDDHKTINSSSTSTIFLQTEQLSHDNNQQQSQNDTAKVPEYSAIFF